MKLPSTDTHFKPQDWDNYQLQQYQTAVAHTRQQRTAIDCGAHVGIMTHRMCEQFEHVVAFEPVWHEYLQQNMQDYTNWELYAQALGKTPGWCSFNVNPTNTGGTHLTTGHDVEVVAIDSLELTNVDMIKMDLEGCELDALLGAEQTIREYEPALLLELERTHPQTKPVMQLLKSWGYTQILRKNADTVWKKG